MAPVLGAIGNKSVNEGAALGFTAAATDADLPANTLTYSLVGAPAGASIGSSSGVFSWTPTEAQGAGSYTFTVRVTDTNPTATNSKNLTDEESITVTVNEVNVAPVLTVPSNQTLNELTTLTVTNTATDVDVPANTLRFELLTPITGMTLNTNTGVMVWTPTEAQGATTNTVTVRLYDNGVPSKAVTNSFIVTVNEINVAPVLAAIGDKSVDEGVALGFTATATDADLPASTLTFSLVGAPAGASIGSSSGVFSWTPTEAQGAGSYTFTVRVTDTNPTATNSKNLTDEESITVTVNEVNVAPVLTVPSNQTLNELTTLTVTNTATDVDVPANTLRFELLTPITGMTLNTNSGVIAWTPNEAQGPSTNTVMVRVYDNGTPVKAATNSFVITVNEVNAAPVLTVPAEQAIHALEPITIEASATDSDLPENTLTFELISGPSGLSINAAGQIAWTPTANQTGLHEVHVKVVDDGSPIRSDEEFFYIDVTDECRILDATIDAGFIQIEWNSISGTVYQVQFSTNLTHNLWLDLSDPIEATAPETSATNTTEASEAFYRVQVLP